jgi:protein-S-isoprenylcysteine O-methyltransferase Ste14
MEIIGKTTINPVFFYTGKIAGYATWIIMFLLLLEISIIDKRIFLFNNYASIFILIIGLIFSAVSLMNLGKSTRLGLPSEKTVFKVNGLYRISRNPMYVGFNLITISAMVYTLNWIVIIPGIYSLTIYHVIILGEEKFMLTRFGEEYKSYKKRVGRYI